VKKTKKSMASVVAIGLVGTTSAYAQNVADAGVIPAADLPLTTTINIGGTDSVGTTFEQDGGALASFEIDGGTINQTVGRFRVGQTSTRTLTIGGGGSFISNTGSQAALVGNGGSGNGTINLNSGTLEITTTGTIFLGRQGGTGLINIDAGDLIFGGSQPTFDDLSGNGSHP